jgi:hypothetical protein
MANTLFGGRLREFDLRHELRLRPVHLAHLISHDASANLSSANLCGKWGKVITSAEGLALDRC